MTIGYIAQGIGHYGRSIYDSFSFQVLLSLARDKSVGTIPDQPPFLSKIRHGSIIGRGALHLTSAWLFIHLINKFLMLFDYLSQAIVYQ